VPVLRLFVRASAFSLLTSAFGLLFPAPAAAQQKEPIPPFVADIRGIFARHKSEPSVATELEVEPGNLPSRSFGLVGGGQVYFLRGHAVTLGVGGSVLLGGGSDTIETTNTDGSVTKSPTVRRHFRSINPEFSLNFGHKNGWSYISAGYFGQSTLYVDREDLPATDPPHRKTLTYGAGARWFTNQHVAFSVEVRWYSVAEQSASPATNIVLEPKTTLMVLSGGISIK
jgi:hypothetical protein